ncbi:MAG TPA: HAD family hydrolase, partial [candidate division Zixibacteria bacterium]
MDAGGVILDESEHERVRSEIIVELLSPFIPGYSIGTYHSDIEEAVRCFCPRTYEYVFWKHLKDEKSLFSKLYESYLERWEKRKPPLKLSSGIEEELREISHDFKIGIAGQYGKELIAFLEQQSLAECFTYHLTQDDFSVTKPDPRYFEQISRAFGVAPPECIMVGDRIDNDIIPAKQLGMKTILIRVGLHRNQQPRILFEVPDIDLKAITGLAKAVK